METDPITQHLSFLYGAETALGLAREVMSLIEAFRTTYRGPSTGIHQIDEKDALLITYGDMVGPSDKEGRGLEKLGHFLQRWNRGLFSYLHILPFHPFTSDDGFSVVSYRDIDERYGSWEDIRFLGEQHKLAFDLVINHGSVSSSWFQGFLANKEPYNRWFITRDPQYDSSSVVRPRTHPLLTPFMRKDGTTLYVWTTFSTDQVDYDFSNPQVLLEFIKILLEYIQRGARIIRLDAIAYLWKEDGTPCLHHPKTHGIVKLLRTIVDYVQVDVLLLTETNVAHRENISYFGEGDESHMVYNFALPPLVLHAALAHDTQPLQTWAADLSSWLDKSSFGPVFLNFLASHDGVGLTPAKGLVDEDSFKKSLDIAQQRGALLSYKATKDGPIPYELNCSYLSVVAPPEIGGPAERARAFLATQAVLLAFRGLPAVYFHSWVGSEQWLQGVDLLGYNRAINRQKIPFSILERDLQTEGTLRFWVYQGFTQLLEFKKQESAMAPSCGQEVIPSVQGLFCLLRGPARDGRMVLCLQNLGPDQEMFPPLKAVHNKAFRRALDTDHLASDWDSPLRGWETRWIAAGGDRPDKMLKI